MGKAKDLTGQRFTRLEVIERAASRRTPAGRPMVQWLCQCDCGRQLIATAQDLLATHTKSCGCLQKEKAAQTLKTIVNINLPELIGKRTERLLVVKEVDDDNYLCQCDCGNTKIINRHHLYGESPTRSCGCIVKEHAARNAALAGHGRLGYRLPPEKKQENHSSWRGGKSPLNMRIRNLQESIDWRNSIFVRDCYTCQICGTKGGVHAHHKKELHQLIDEFNITTIEEAIACPALWDIDNGITVCVPCHEKIHGRFVGKNSKKVKKVSYGSSS